MLLLLESRPLVNPQAYEQLLHRTIGAYWQNESLHPDDYLPIVLVNDIVRYWRILLLNHESRLRAKSKKDDLSPDQASALRRYSSYKLRVPRCLSCFSALAYLLALAPDEPAHIDRADVVELAGMTPIERLWRLPERGAPRELVDELEALYAAFLERTDGGKTVLTDRLQSDPGFANEISRDGQAFTNRVFDLIQNLGGGRPLHRAIVV